MMGMAGRRFLLIWMGFTFLYTALAALGPSGLLATGAWPQVNQYLLQARAWYGDDIEVRDQRGRVELVIPVRPRLDVTPYFRHWSMADPRERGLLANLACGVRSGGPDGPLKPVRYVAADSALGQAQLTGLVCEVGMPLGPALVLLPLFVLLKSAVAVQWVGAVLGGLAVALMDVLLPWWLAALRGEDSLLPAHRNRLVLLAGAGTLWLWLVPQPGTWMFAQTTATCALSLALVLAWRRRWLTAGLAWGLAVISRPPTVFALPLLVAVLLYRTADRSEIAAAPRRRRGQALALAALFPLMLVGGQLALDQVRFGSPLEVGYSYMLTPPELRQRVAAHGLLSPAYAARNLWYEFVQPPVVVLDPATRSPRFPFLASDPYGMGLLFVTPAFLAVLLTLGRRTRAPALLWACWLSLGLVTLPAVLHFNTGWVQWGNRYLLDAWPLWLMLAALGLERMRSRWATGLVALSVASNLWAAIVAATGRWPVG